MSKILGWAFPCRRLLVVCDGGSLLPVVFDCMFASTEGSHACIREDSTGMLALPATFALGWAGTILKKRAELDSVFRLGGHSFAVLEDMWQGLFVSPFLFSDPSLLSLA